MSDTPTAAVNHERPDHRKETVERIRQTEAGEPIYENYSQRIRLEWESPAPTILCGGERPQWQLAHPDQPRGLTVREMARIQSFPDNHVFVGAVTEQRKQVGNAVPTEVMMHLAEQVRDFRGCKYA